MPINNHPEEQHREQLRYRAEDLRGQVDELIELLDKELGAGNYVIGRDGSVTVKLSEWEINPKKKELIGRTEKDLKKFYKEIEEIGEEIGFDVIRKSSQEIIH